ncbi:hypothetical protein WN48_03400 [Eufriesea mexicana]|uniref:Uncharacterized protein n=1 Tax=Eufriesea mexicana TaxID=516756 RepID=A0A310SKC0_9HYME|nr:hypothetical protein WN48_03400 [Eufriesea mexicana]
MRRNQKRGRTAKQETENRTRKKCQKTEKKGCRAGNKGYQDEECRLCGNGKENLEHAWTCKELRKLVKDETIRNVDEAMRKVDGRKNNNWRRLITGEINPEICKYIRDFERTLRKKTEDRQENRVEEQDNE